MDNYIYLYLFYYLYVYLYRISICVAVFGLHYPLHKRKIILYSY